MEKNKIRVLIAEDSVLIQKVLKNMIENDDRFELVGVAANGKQAVELTQKLKPDVISMDVNMPELDGVGATKQIMDIQPTPIVIVSSYYNSSEIELAIRVLDAGAVTIMEKPNGPGHPKYDYTLRTYLNRLKSMSEIKVVRRKNKDSENKEVLVKTEKNTKYTYSGNFRFSILVVGASAGGPESARQLFEKLASDFPLPIVFVQHIDSHFADGFAVWLNSYSNIPVVIAYDNQVPEAGKIYMPPGGKHIIIDDNNHLKLVNETVQNVAVPSVNKLFESAAKVYGSKTIAVILSGMGRDGAEMMKKLRNEGAYTYAQDEKTCLVYGMPKEAYNLGAVIKMLSPAEISADISALIRNNL